MAGRAAATSTRSRPIARSLLIVGTATARLQVPGPKQFRFPHFYLIGFQKCATTSLFQ